MGVSTSTKPLSSKNLLAAFVISFLKKRFFCKEGLLKSRYLYFKRRVSFTFESSRISKGVVSASAKILSSSARISISPVAILLVLLSLSLTLPFTARTYSERIFCAFSNTAAAVVSSKTTCTSPVLSRRSTKISEPRFLLLCVHPITVTSLPASESLSVPHIEVRLNSPINSAIMLSPLLYSGIYPKTLVILTISTF